MVDLELIFHITDCGEKQINVEKKIKNNGEKPETTDIVIHQTTAIYYTLLNELIEIIKVYEGNDGQIIFIKDAIKELAKLLVDK